MNTNETKDGTHLGLPPMELAESKTMDSESNFASRRYFLTLIQFFLKLLLLFMFAFTFYFFISKQIYSSENTKGAEIIVVSNLNEGKNLTATKGDMEILVHLNNVTSSHYGLVRHKRQIPIIESETSQDQSNVIEFMSEEQMQRAREIIMKHDKICSRDNQQEICRNLVMKLKAIIDNDKVGKNSNRKQNINNRNWQSRINDDEKGTIPPVVKHFDLHHQVPIHLRQERPIRLNDACALARILKQIPHVHGVIYEDATSSEENNHRNPLPHRYISGPIAAFPEENSKKNPFVRFVPETVAPFQKHDHFLPKEDHQESHPHKMHPQDLNIFMNFFSSLTTSANRTVLSATKSRSANCKKGQVSCRTVDTCIDEDQWCDSKVDCSDSSDELSCDCKSRIDQSRLCDGYFDCPLGEDEMGCYGCDDKSFSCEDVDDNSLSTCFTKEQRCNNVLDCQNRRDEFACTMLAPSIHEKPVFAISNTDGFLLRNYKGNWYPVCRNPYLWARDVCRRETGFVIRPPYIQLVPIVNSQNIQYVNTDAGGLMHLSNTCFNSTAIHVTCPDILCGTRDLSGAQLLKENDVIESHLFGRNKRFLYPLHATISNRKEMARGKRLQERVVGGKPSEPASWPWIVALYRDGTFHCGGVILSQNWVMSAAHCVKAFWEHYYEVQVGMLRRFSFSPQEQNHLVTHIVVNQHYSQEDMKNDLSLLRVNPAIQFGQWVRPICLPGPNTAGDDWLMGPAAGTICTAVGWGATKERGPDPDHLREVEMPVWGECKHREDKSGKEICAGLIEGGRDACQGDSGGPLLCRNPLNPAQWYMAGIVSHGDGCGRKNEPGAYTRVSMFVKWIRFYLFSKTLPVIKPLQECPGFKCTSGIIKCLPKKRICDKIIDCLNGEDEKNCDYTKLESIFQPTKLLTEILNARNIKENKLINSTLQKEVENTTKVNHKNKIITEYVTTLWTKSTESTEKTIEGEFKEITITRPTTEDTTQPPMKFRDQNSENDLENNMKHASTIEISIDKSFSESESDENFNKEPATPKSETIHTNRGDTQFPETFSTESIDLNNISGNIGDNFINIVNPLFNESSTKIVGDSTESTFILDNNFESTTVNLIQATTVDVTSTESNPDLDVVTMKSLKIITNKREDIKQSTEVIIKLLPADNMVTPSEFESIEIKPTIHNRTLEITQNSLQTLDDKHEVVHKIENILFSEMQLPKIRRKHKIPREFECWRISQIIPYTSRCDHQADCEDGTDELDCSCIDYISSLDDNLLCDGVSDCSDGQDELDCFTCPESHFLCKNSQVCIPNIHVCDGKSQCPQQEDEKNCYALSNGHDIDFDIDDKPRIKLSGFVTKRFKDHWNIVCEDNLPSKEQESSANNICQHLGFSSAQLYYIKYISIKEENLEKSEKHRERRSEVPVKFVYKKADNNSSVYIPIKDPKDVGYKCQIVPQTCMALYVKCDRTLFNNIDITAIDFLSRSSEVSYLLPWIAKIYVDGNYKCTGVLLDLSWVLISHFCLWDSVPGHHYVKVILGSHRTHTSINGPFEQIYLVDTKKDLYRSKVALLHLREPAMYSTMVKPMSIPLDIQYDEETVCLAVGQDPRNNTIAIIVEEQNEHCDPHNRCFKSKGNKNICGPEEVINREWAGLISCHTKKGWYPAASFVDSRGECKTGNTFITTNVGYLRNELKELTASEITVKDSTEDLNEECEGIRCSRGRCINLRDVCNGVRNCEDGIDESEQACVKKTSLCEYDPYYKGCDCASGELKCKNGKCIPKDLFNNGKNDCGDATDEPEHSTCFDYLSRVMPSRLCDGVLHCHDRSDENPKICKCFAKKFYKCGNRRDDVEYCVAPDMACDGVVDCPNGEDETTCLALNSPEGTAYGTGEVLVRSYGQWHRKCYPKQNHTRSELEAVCRELGFLSGHAKQLEPPSRWIGNAHNNIELQTFSNVTLNNNTIIKLRNTHMPIARTIFDENKKNCYPLYIECR